MSSSTKISIVTICFNAVKDLEKTIRSVKAQTYDNIEYIIVDGGSKDGTLDVIRCNNDCISKYISEHDKGIYDAMNKGIDLATGEWIIFMNAGDLFYKNDVVEKLMSKDYSPNTAIVYGDVELDFGKVGKLIKSLRRIDKDSVATELCHQAVMTRADVLKQIKYDMSFRIMADLNSFVTIYNNGYSFEYVPIIFATFEVTGGISSTKPLKSFKEMCRVKGIESYSLQYLKSFILALNKTFMLYVLPKDIYDRIRYKKVSSIKIYKPNESDY